MSTAKALLDIARAELGTKEYPAGTNNVKYNSWYYKRDVSGNYPWCMVFVQWCMYQAGIVPPITTASCGSLMTRAKKTGQWVTKDFQPGDVLIYDFGGTGHDHTGICESCTSSTVTAIEGNTSVSNASNGGQVLRMTRSLSKVTGAWRPQYEEDTMSKEEILQLITDELDKRFPIYGTIDDVPEWYRPSIQKLVDRGALKGTDPTGTVLNLSEEMCRIFTILDRVGLI